MTGSTAKLCPAKGWVVGFCSYIFAQSVLLLAAPVFAQEERVETLGLSTAKLYRLCAAGSPDCTAYIAGVIDTAILNHTLFSVGRGRGFVGPGQISFCFPGEIRNEDPAKLFMDFVEENPGQGEFSAAEGVLLALNEKFPCAPGATQ